MTDQGNLTLSALIAPTNWVTQLLTGTLGLSIATLAMASVGFLLLRGHLALHRGVQVVLGCFILFGAPMIAHGLMAATGNAHTTPQAVSPQVSTPPAVAVPATPPQFDPYAGASVPR